MAYNPRDSYYKKAKQEGYRSRAAYKLLELQQRYRLLKPGDAVDVWFDFDGDKVPDLHLSGDAFSEFTVHKAKSFTKDGKDISNKDVARLSMAGTTSQQALSALVSETDHSDL